MLAKKTLELNPHHPVIKEMLSRVKAADGGEIDEETKEYADLLYNAALLNSGFIIENPSEFTQPIQKLLKLGFGLKRDAAVEEIEVEIDPDEEDAKEGDEEVAEEEVEQQVNDEL